ncbi:hypothetical protein D3C78_20330 [compost metagenome]
MNVQEFLLYVQELIGDHIDIIQFKWDTYSSIFPEHITSADLDRGIAGRTIYYANKIRFTIYRCTSSTNQLDYEKRLIRSYIDPNFVANEIEIVAVMDFKHQYDQQANIIYIKDNSIYKLDTQSQTFAYIRWDSLNSEMEKTFLEKENGVFVDRSLPDWMCFFTSEGDLYKNPCNIHIQNNIDLKEYPDVYNGNRLFIIPNLVACIRFEKDWVKVDHSWLDVSYDRLNQDIKDEYLLWAGLHDMGQVDSSILA